MICLNRSVLDFMDSVLTPESFVLEFGAGGSTEWFLHRCEWLTTIETKKEWADKCVHDGMCLAEDPGAISLSHLWEKMDLVLIDGEAKFRNTFSRKAWATLKRGGWLVFDDAQRPQHANAVAWLSTFAEPVRLEWSTGDVESAKERLALAWQK